ncbi:MULTISPECIES: nitroreductase [unclassified Lysobacter]|uniref:nitroreductase family protein n=1 Tax=unclassified Lysobacter TaxID=2635362 RepID=UPI0006F3CA7C|nr:MULTISPECIES: nitroreductase [unclassified Lysobacter]KRA14895.1 nitroreductase [Lysobacter sp. Root604]KRD75469.1 nitroreductase [Lysobacter sp. Root983]
MSRIDTDFPPESEKALAALDTRRSVPAKQLTEPGPDPRELERMLRSAVRVPDHGKRVPFRFLSIRGDARHALGERLAARGRERDPGAGEAAVEKDRGRFSHAPLIVVVIARLGPDEKIPEQERLLTAGSVCFALLQAAQALGYGAVWLTGWPAYDPQVLSWLGLGADERVAGFIHIGTPKLEAPERERPDPLALLTAWTPE